MTRHHAVALLFLMQLYYGENCPEECQCFSAAKVICSEDKMRVLPNISTQVKELIVVASGVTHLEISSFRENLKLTKLVILNRRLKEVSCKAFDHLVELQELEISGNDHLFTFEVQTFNKLTNLTRLFLNNNMISVLYSVMFDSLQKLETLQLRGNNLSYLPNLLFRNMHKLQELDLSFNRISFLSSDVFQNNSLLRVFSMQGNMITELPLEIFAHLNSLEELNFQNNNIANLEHGMFPTSLRKLILKKNKLVQLSSGVFHKLQLLSYLDLSQNHLSELPMDLFHNLISLKNLDLSENQIVSLPSTVFKGLFGVRTINLHKNNLSMLEESLLRDQQVMEKLYLSMNNLQNIPNGFFDYLDFQCIVQLHGNPWRCDCEIHYFFDWLRYNNNVKDLIRIYCNYPEFIRGHSLVSMDKEMLVCLKNVSSEFSTAPIAQSVCKIPFNNYNTNQCSLQELKGATSIQCKVTKCTSLKFQAVFEPTNGNESEHIVSTEWSAPGGCFNGTL
ncbi:carboxypeptidase N subunit 2 [Triplophysa rosa]|uniref:Carboxypeptidase N subunit 2 n=1 Tax=Triplophysa rosa TaxID=992332 RepID=A0A9W7T310_TRIRA|nr:carboxypeptidase N subunit 2 [Triplophysa rosa]KAI7790483.1 carboxypeptidase N subunit 2 precursor [Triplophysa rosa]